MVNKNGTIFLTLISALFFCTLTIIISLSPLAKIGPNANEFGSFGMWSAVGMLLTFYLIPLIIYILGVDQMRNVMGVFCIIGMLVPITIISLVLLLFVGKLTSSLIVVVGLCLTIIMTNMIWLIVAFRPFKNR